MTLDSPDSQDSPWPKPRGSHHLPPYSILCASPRHLHPNGFLSRDFQGGVLKLSWFRLLPFCAIITLCSDLRLGWGLKQTCSSCQDLSSSVSHSTYMHRNQVDFWLLVVGSQIGLSFCHNLCCKCPNASCEPIFDICTSIAFQWY
jgi:hypothetical protein